MVQTRDALDLERATEAWLKSKGVRLVEVTDAEQRLARQRLSRLGDPSRRRALRLVALWSLAPELRARAAHPIGADLADFIGAEGFAIEDGYGERTLVSEEDGL